MEDLKKVLGQMKEAQSNMKDIQEKLEHLQAIGESGAGAVKATVNGHKKLLQLEIDKTFIDPTEKEMLQDLIIAAITLAHQAVAEKIKTILQESTWHMMDNMPADLLL